MKNYLNLIAMKKGFTSTRNFLHAAISLFLIPKAFIAYVQNVWILITPDSVCAPLVVQFSDSTATGCVIANRFWDFNDGMPSTLSNPTHVYNFPGIYLVELIVQDSTGILDTAYTTITVSAGFLVSINTTS